MTGAFFLPLVALLDKRRDVRRQKDGQNSSSPEVLRGLLFGTHKNRSQKAILNMTDAGHFAGFTKSPIYKIVKLLNRLTTKNGHGHLDMSSVIIAPITTQSGK